jgi:hypothetical protein
MNYFLSIPLGAIQPDREGIVSATLSGIDLGRANFMVIAAVGRGNAQSVFSNEIRIPKR